MVKGSIVSVNALLGIRLSPPRTKDTGAVQTPSGPESAVESAPHVLRMLSCPGADPPATSTSSLLKPGSGWGESGPALHVWLGAHCATTATYTPGQLGHEVRDLGSNSGFENY